VQARDGGLKGLDLLDGGGKFVEQAAKSTLAALHQRLVFEESTVLVDVKQGVGGQSLGNISQRIDLLCGQSLKTYLESFEILLAGLHTLVDPKDRLLVAVGYAQDSATLVQ
jgi:hypothetical protein